MSAYFHCDNLHAYDGESYILRGVGLSLEQNERLALLGRNGAGKSNRNDPLGWRTAKAGGRPGAGPRRVVFLLDNPYESLAPLIVKDIERMLITLKVKGMTINFVEQNATGALKIADRCVIIETGEVVFDGDPQ